jgi:hypothetical protein
VNTYTIDFFGTCPKNGLRVAYKLKISTGEVIPVEDILAAADLSDDKFHEDIADEMLTRFGGQQTLVADHHGVRIETIRPHIAHWQRQETKP